jgi:MinD-like ATPase involved in chromosome partitioning or flagellar assembly
MSTAATLRVYATVTGPTATFVSHDGHRESLVATADEDIRAAVMRRATDEARRVGVPLELVTGGDRGEHRLVIATDGGVSRTPLRTHDVLEAIALRDNIEVATLSTSGVAPSHDAPINPGQRATFIAPDAAHPPAPRRAGLRGLLLRLGFVSTSSDAETARAEAVRLVSQHWAGCRSIAVVNGKGGVGKTLSTAMLASVYGRYGGGNVLAWDNNDTRGTLGWRTETGRYDTTIRDLLPEADSLLAPHASISDIAAYVHHQSADRYDVLRSNPELLAVHQRIARAEFDRLLQVVSRYYRLVIFDSGNDESADRWLRMIDSSSQLVIPTLTTPESAESAALLLDALHARDHRSSALAANAVVVVTQSERTRKSEARAIADRFVPLVRAVEIVPFDSALKSGPLRHDALRPSTREAWLRVAAAAASEL